jgi:hypothetical protein
MAAPFLVISGWARQAIEPMKWKIFPVLSSLSRRISGAKRLQWLPV